MREAHNTSSHIISAMLVSFSTSSGHFDHVLPGIVSTLPGNMKNLEPKVFTFKVKSLDTPGADRKNKNKNISQTACKLYFSFSNLQRYKTTYKHPKSKNQNSKTLFIKKNKQIPTSFPYKSHFTNSLPFLFFFAIQKTNHLHTSKMKPEN
ncbi:hypothetical protein DFH28DRAFT_177559 [Melampsora americana]|nr:hypothetical protein DFH28DRAFT_177559 [Melampsora americana]